MSGVLLDLCCGAGGSAMGYHRAGYAIIGVDRRPQPNYPFHFIQAEAVSFLRALIRFGTISRYAAIHASPPCQAYANQAKQRGTASGHPDLIDPLRRLLDVSMRPYVIENIPSAWRLLHDPVRLCGTQFGLGVFRHRYFETGRWKLPELPHALHEGKVGDGNFVTVAGNTGGSSFADGYANGGKADWQRATGIDWMTTREMAQAIPPAYTEYIGGELRKVTG